MHNSLRAQSKWKQPCQLVATRLCSLEWIVLRRVCFPRTSVTCAAVCHFEHTQTCSHFEAHSKALSCWLNRSRSVGIETFWEKAEQTDTQTRWTEWGVKAHNLSFCRLRFAGIFFSRREAKAAHLRNRDSDLQGRTSVRPNSGWLKYVVINPPLFWTKVQLVPRTNKHNERTHCLFWKERLHLGKFQAFSIAVISVSFSARTNNFVIVLPLIPRWDPGVRGHVGVQWSCPREKPQRHERASFVTSESRAC